jgi:hypothetical protein
VRNFHRRLLRLEQEALAPAADRPAWLWSWVAREPLPEAEAAACQAWARENLPKGLPPSGVGNTERRIQAVLDARLAAERPKCGLRELNPGGP